MLHIEHALRFSCRADTYALDREGEDLEQLEGRVLGGVHAHVRVEEAREHGVGGLARRESRREKRPVR